VHPCVVFLIHQQRSYKRTMFGIKRSGTMGSDSTVESEITLLLRPNSSDCVKGWEIKAAMSPHGCAVTVRPLGIRPMAEPAFAASSTARCASAGRWARRCHSGTTIDDVKSRLYSVRLLRLFDG
jgi:hypothetical protein